MNFVRVLCKWHEPYFDSFRSFQPFHFRIIKLLLVSSWRHLTTVLLRFAESQSQNFNIIYILLVISWRHLTTVLLRFSESQSQTCSISSSDDSAAFLMVELFDESRLLSTFFCQGRAVWNLLFNPVRAFARVSWASITACKIKDQFNEEILH